mgnify:CR=1 FL=1
MTEEQQYVSLKEHFNTRIVMMEKAIEIARNGMDRRLDAMNEFRASLKDATMNSPTRNEMQLAIEKLEVKIQSIIAPLEGDVRDLRDSKNILAGKASQQSVNLSLLFSIIGVVISVTAIIIHLIK